MYIRLEETGSQLSFAEDYEALAEHERYLNGRDEALAEDENCLADAA